MDKNEKDPFVLLTPEDIKWIEEHMLRWDDDQLKELSYWSGEGQMSTTVSC